MTLTKLIIIIIILCHNESAQETEGIMICKLTEEMNHLKVTVNEMSLLLIHEIDENQNIDLKDTGN